MASWVSPSSYTANNQDIPTNNTTVSISSDHSIEDPASDNESIEPIEDAVRNGLGVVVSQPNESSSSNSVDEDDGDNELFEVDSRREDGLGVVSSQVDLSNISGGSNSDDENDDELLIGEESSPSSPRHDVNEESSVAARGSSEELNCTAPSIGNNNGSEDSTSYSSDGSSEGYDELSSSSSLSSSFDSQELQQLPVPPPIVEDNVSVRAENNRLNNGTVAQELQQLPVPPAEISVENGSVRAENNRPNNGRVALMVRLLERSNHVPAIQVQPSVINNPVVQQPSINVNIPNNMPQTVHVSTGLIGQPRSLRDDDKLHFGIKHAVIGCVAVGIGYWLFQKYFMKVEFKEEARTAIRE